MIKEKHQVSMKCRPEQLEKGSGFLLQDAGVTSLC